MGLFFFVKLDLSFNKLMERSDSSEFLFKERTGNHFKVDFHFDELTPILDFCLDRGFFTDFKNLVDQFNNFMMVEILHLFVSQEFDVLLSD